MCEIVAQRGMASFVSLSALVSAIFQETGWGPFPPSPRTGRGLNTMTDVMCQRQSSIVIYNNVCFLTYGRFDTCVEQDAHFAPVLNLANFRPQRETIQGCDELSVERKINGLFIH